MVNNPIHNLAIDILGSYLENNPDYGFEAGDVAQRLNESIIHYKVAEKESNFAAARVNAVIILNENLLDNNGNLNDEGVFAVAHEGAHFLRKFEHNSFIDEAQTQTIALFAVEKHGNSIGKTFVERATYVPHTVTYALLSSLVGTNNIKNFRLSEALNKISKISDFGGYFEMVTKRAHSFYHACKWAEKNNKPLAEEFVKIFQDFYMDINRMLVSVVYSGMSKEEQKIVAAETHRRLTELKNIKYDGNKGVDDPEYISKCMNDIDREMNNVHINKWLNSNIVFENALKRLDIFRGIYGKQIDEMNELAKKDASSRFYYFDRAEYYDDYVQGMRVRLKIISTKADGSGRPDPSINRGDVGGSLNNI